MASLQQHRVEGGIGVKQVDRRIAIPKAQSLDLVDAFQMRHPELEHRAGAPTTDGGCDPRAGHVADVEWGCQR